MDSDKMGPLAQMLIDHAEVIDNVIDQHGPSAVAEFFINTGTAMAAMYGLGDLKFNGTSTVEQDGATK